MVTEATRQPARVSSALAESPRVLAVVVTHRGRRWLRDCLVALSTQTYRGLDVLVVDDASPDHREQPRLKRIVKRHLRKRRWGFLRTRRPLGFGGAVNWAMSRVRTDVDLLLFLHDDVALEPESVENMVRRIMSDDQTAVVGPKVVAWDDPSRLEEVGMAVDRFGYPYKGLDRGEIDLGQHDVASEVFYVTSTCMLIRHAVFRQLRGWDARMRAFSEDLDLCWRARIAGYTVMVEPQARARHAIALATGQRRSRFTPTRYYIRRNRLRAVAKSASAARLIGLIPQFVLLSITEMLGFIVLRQPVEIFHILRALAWNVIAAPQTMTERLRVQRTRRIGDRSLRRFTVRESTRVRAYVSNQTERLEDAWGRRTEVMARRSQQARQMTRSMSGWPAMAGIAAVAALGLGLRHFFFSPPVTVGELLPYPAGVTTLWRTFASPWQASGLGAPGPTSPALLLLGALPAVTLGAVGAAQKLLLVALGMIGFAGAYHLLAGITARPARIVAGFAYVFGPLGLAGMREGALGALALGAVAPFALRALFEATGWSRPAGWDQGRGIARIALTSALAGAFVPGSLLLLGAAAVLLSALRLVIGPTRGWLRGMLTSVGGVVFGGLLLLPWSATWFRDGGVGDRLLDGTGQTSASAFEGHDMVTVLLARTPRGPVALGFGFVVLSLLALLLATGQRRRLAFALSAIVVIIGWATTAFSTGLLPAPVDGPTEAGALAAASFAGLAGLAVGAVRLDLPRRRLGTIQFASIAALGVAAALAALGLGPSIWHGGWTPGRGVDSADPTAMTSIRSLIGAEASGAGPSRVLWVGDEFAGTSPGSLGGSPERLVTGADGETLGDLFARPVGAGTAALTEATDAIETGATDRGGHLLGGFNVRFVVLSTDVDADSWTAQRDLAVIRSEPGYIVLSNDAVLPRAGLFDSLPAYVAALAAGDPAESARGTTEARRVVARRGPSRYESEGPTGSGVVWLAESDDPGWTASQGGRALRRGRGGWGNLFVLGDGSGDLRIAFRTPGEQLVILAAVVLAWIVVVGAAASKARPVAVAGPTREVAA